MTLFYEMGSACLWDLYLELCFLLMDGSLGQYEVTFFISSEEKYLQSILSDTRVTMSASP